MVSTRGVKFEFSEGQRVLCYEPDPTKAKVLYDSKVLRLVVGRDDRGRKIPEYLIHFSGWNSSWDRCVIEEFILPDTEENRNLQQKLAEDAALSLKGKHKRKLPPIIKETLIKKECLEDAEDAGSTMPSTILEPSSESEFSEEEMEKATDLEIPAPLKSQLEDDFYCITKKNKIIKIPCEPNVVSVLEAYVKHLAVTLLCVSPPKNSKSRSTSAIPEDVESKLDLCKEVMDGLRIYFDFTLPHLLLYHQEQTQYYTVGKICRPVSGMKRDQHKLDKRSAKSEHKAKNLQPTPESSNLQVDTQPAELNAPPPPVVPTVTRGRPSLRNSSHHSKHYTSPEVATNGNVNTSNNSKPRGVGRPPLNKGEKEKSVGMKRILRSSDKSKLSESLTNSSVLEINKRNPAGNDKSPARPDSPNAPTSPNRPGRATKAIIQSSASPAAVSSVNSSHIPSVSNQSQNASGLIGTPPLSSQNSDSLPPLNMTTVATNINSPALSTHSSLSSPQVDGSSYRTINASGVLSEILSWNMLPSEAYDQISSPPSLIYGAQHLLRLFVKLPELIYKMNIPKKKIIPLMGHLEVFLKYLSERREEIFLPSVYVDVLEAFPEGSGVVQP